MVNFNEIPASLLTPGNYVEIDNSRAVKGTTVQPQVALLIGQRLTTGTVAAEVPTLVTRLSQCDEYAGRGSQAARMAKAFKTANEYTELWLLLLADAASGVAATGEIAFASTPTKDGTISLYISGERVRVAVTTSQTAAAIATAVAAAINAETNLPLTAAVNGTITTQVDLTARNKGVCGNDLDLRLNYYQGEATPAGLTVTITAMADGANNPDLGDAIDAIGGVQYTTIVQPYTDAANLTELEAAMLARFGAMVNAEGHVFTAARGSVATLSALGATRNTPFTTCLGTGASPSEPAVCAAIAGAVDATESHPARPRQTLVLTGMLPPAPAEIWERSERNVLLSDGIATFTVDAGGLCRVERFVTMYRVNAQGLPDPSYQDVETLRTLSRKRFDVRAMFSQKYPRHMLADDDADVDPGVPVMTERLGRSEVLALAKDNWVPQAMMENYEQFKTDLVVQRNAQDRNRLDVLLAPDLVNQFRIGAFQIQFIH